ncbi:MAG: DUF5060 domain-containing protein [Candidatus Brocadiia bacterium]
MQHGPERLSRGQVGQWRLHAERDYGRPSADVDVTATFRAPDGQEFTVPGFYAGDDTWCVRFSPGRPGQWTYAVSSMPSEPGLRAQGSFQVEDADVEGFLRATPGEAWGFHFQSGRPVLIFGDTTYNLFAMAHCGGPVEQFIRRRAEQGVNLLRVRLAVSPFHPPEGYSRWQTRSCWPWGGSEQSPEFDRFNQDWFRTVDEVVELCESVGMGLEMVMEAWGFEFPWNRRDVFLPEWEQLWLRHLVARYDAYSCVWFWTLMNEYEYYPDGRARHSRACDRWAVRIARWLKRTAPHGHIVSLHNAPPRPPFAERFRRDPDAIDHWMFQAWGSIGEDDGWLAAGIEEAIAASLEGWPGTAVLSEYGYERNPELPEAFPPHRHCDVEHTRRGGWRGLFSGLGIIHGWENSWGPYMLLEEDQAGMEQFLLMRRFFHQIVPFEKVRPAPALVQGEGWDRGHAPLAMADAERELVAVYLPVGGEVTLKLPEGKRYGARWFDVRTGKLSAAAAENGRYFSAPAGGGEHPYDWILVLEAR